MTQEDYDRIKMWIKGNLEISVSLQDEYGPDNSVDIGLRIKGEEYPFTYTSINIPSVED